MAESPEVPDFGVTGDGELDLGLDDMAPPLPGGFLDEDWVDRGWEPGDHGDPQSDPDDDEEWLASLPADVRADYLAGPFTGEGGPIPAGFLHHDRSGPYGVGFAAGGVLDTAEPDWWLARALKTATAGGYDGLGESELIGVLCASRRMASWAAAGEAAAVVTLAKRRAGQSAAPGSSHLADHVVDELAAALTLTGRSAARLLEAASGIDRLPDVHAALAQGQIDWAKACVFADELAVLDDEGLAAALAARFLGRAGAGGWTTGQLRAALRRAVLATDPDAADRRRAEARKDASVRTFDEASGNAGLAGRELPPAEVLAADARLTTLARWLQRRGAPGTISQLRAAVYTALLNGRPLTSLLDETNASGDTSVPGDPAAPGAADAHGDTGATGGVADCLPVSGSIHLTMPLSAFLGSGEPGDVAGHGPVDAATGRQLAARLSSGAATRWCVTVTGPDGRAAGHACARRGPEAGELAIHWAAGLLRAKLQVLESGGCSHARRSQAYTPPNSLRHLVGVRQRRCCYPGCRRPAARCDLDHTIPFDQGGATCECNLAPLCRRHHQAKQAPGWQLTQARPGEMTWRTPSGRVYKTVGDPY